MGAEAEAVPREAPRRGHALRLERITHRFGAVTAVDGVDIDVRPGELLALLGPSGCGKTTLLRVIAGFLAPTAGRVLVDGEPIGHLPPNRRGVGIVFQSYALFPHMSVAGNVAFDNVPVSLFLADERTEMLPIHLWQQIETNLEVRTAAASGVIVVMTLLLMFLAERLAGLSRHLR